MRELQDNRIRACSITEVTGSVDFRSELAYAQMLIRDEKLNVAHGFQQVTDGGMVNLETYCDSLVDAVRSRRRKG